MKTSPSGNSTNVRALPSASAPPTHPARLGVGGLLGATLAAWSAFVGALAAGGVFERIGPAFSAAFLAFACAYALALGVLDREVRDQLAHMPRGALAAFALGADAIAVIAWLASEGGVGTVEGLLRFPQSWIAATVAPLALLAHAAALQRPALLSSAPAKSPRGSPAAT